ncbi:MAG TPA: DUF924 family protein [Geminicoccus sp.]|jgi:uncharacterized protein (DUF924 family)|uniref:DUF924 family protein n=1 Tax=Geminicoccus sp. TaxID=2024832 RepID=UPI002E32743D|nr:DUF924 family protein [Geminicoccus sp.]HEX2527326.1 DUF924 family protein [Geminicoccus sp.]
MHRRPVEDILSFWFGVPDRTAWFKADVTFDQALGEAFEELVLPATAGGLDDWTTTPDGATALLLVLDQFPRNIYRGTPRAFASDAKAREVARDVLAAGLDRQVPEDRRPFLYLPFEHSERLEDQDLCCRLMATLEDPEMLDYAERHRVIIRRFGRFPHRNLILGRVSTPEEEEFLKEPGSSF